MKSDRPAMVGSWAFAALLACAVAVSGRGMADGQAKHYERWVKGKALDQQTSKKEPMEGVKPSSWLTGFSRKNPDGTWEIAPEDSRVLDSELAFMATPGLIGFIPFVMPVAQTPFIWSFACCFGGGFFDDLDKVEMLDPVTLKLITGNQSMSAASRYDEVSYQPKKGGNGHAWSTQWISKVGAATAEGIAAHAAANDPYGTAETTVPARNGETKGAEHPQYHATKKAADALRIETAKKPLVILWAGKPAKTHVVDISKLIDALVAKGIKRDRIYVLMGQGELPADEEFIAKKHIVNKEPPVTLLMAHKTSLNAVFDQHFGQFTPAKSRPDMVMFFAGDHGGTDHPGIKVDDQRQPGPEDDYGPASRRPAEGCKKVGMGNIPTLPTPQKPNDPPPPNSDCNANAIDDAVELAAAPALDCDGDGVLDSCQLGADPGLDIDGDGELDSCQGDCDGNGVPDAFDIAMDPGVDGDANGVVDACEDCNGNGIADGIDLAMRTSLDTDDNDIPDECDRDSDLDGTPDTTEIDGGEADLNGNLAVDGFELEGNDCNANGVPDDADIALGTSLDDDQNGIPDECVPTVCVLDLNNDGIIGSFELNVLLATFGDSCVSGGCMALDADGDCTIGSDDLNILLSVFGTICAE